jgi:hypothetical protein
MIVEYIRTRSTPVAPASSTTPNEAQARYSTDTWMCSASVLPRRKAAMTREELESK